MKRKFLRFIGIFTIMIFFVGCSGKNINRNEIYKSESDEKINLIKKYIEDKEYFKAYDLAKLLLQNKEVKESDINYLIDICKGEAKEYYLKLLEDYYYNDEKDSYIEIRDNLCELYLDDKNIIDEINAKIDIFSHLVVIDKVLYGSYGFPTTNIFESFKEKSRIIFNYQLFDNKWNVTTQRDGEYFVYDDNVFNRVENKYLYPAVFAPFLDDNWKYINSIQFNNEKVSLTYKNNGKEIVPDTYTIEYFGEGNNLFGKGGKVVFQYNYEDNKCSSITIKESILSSYVEGKILYEFSYTNDKLYKSFEYSDAYNQSGMIIKEYIYNNGRLESIALQSVQEGSTGKFEQTYIKYDDYGKVLEIDIPRDGDENYYRMVLHYNKLGYCEWIEDIYHNQNGNHGNACLYYSYKSINKKNVDYELHIKK